MRPRGDSWDLARQEEVVELPLLLQTAQLRALVEAAAQRRMSAAQLLRLLMLDYLHDHGLVPELERLPLHPGSKRSR